MYILFVQRTIQLITLEYHSSIKISGFKVNVLPAWRPDAAMMVDTPATFNSYVDKLEKAANYSISNYPGLISAIDKRHQFFHDNGCRLSDHGLDTIYAADYTEKEITAIFLKVRSGKSLSPEEIVQFKSVMLYEFGVMDHRRGWTQQFHLGALRNNNTRLFNQLGPDKGFDSIGDLEIARPLSKLLNKLDMANKLAKTVLYNLNPRDNYLIATMTGNFQDGSVPGKDPIRIGLVVPRSERWNGRANENALQPGPSEQVCRDADRFKKFSLLSPARILSEEFYATFWATML